MDHMEIGSKLFYWYSIVSILYDYDVDVDDVFEIIIMEYELLLPGGGKKTGIERDLNFHRMSLQCH